MTRRPRQALAGGAAEADSDGVAAQEWACNVAGSRVARRQREDRRGRQLAGLLCVRESGAQTPASIAAALPIPKERAKKALQRLANQGKLVRTPSGYEPSDAAGTFSCITTSLGPEAKLEVPAGTEMSGSALDGLRRSRAD